MVGLTLAGLFPLAWSGLASRQWNVLRIALIDPAVVVVGCYAAIRWWGPATLGALGRVWRALISIPSVPFTVAVAGLGGAFASIAAWLCYRAQPVLTDEMAQAFQGRILLSGRVAAVPEPHPEFFNTAQTIESAGRWFAEFPIGSGALAAIGSATGLPWLLNPLLIALAIWGAYAFVRRAVDEPTARVTAVLLALSPFAAFMAGSRMNHVPSLALTIAALVALARWSETDDPLRGSAFAAAVGGAVGALVLLRPYDAVLIAIPIGLFQLHAISKRPAMARSLVAQLVVGCAVTAVQLWVNARTTGSALLFGYDALNGPAHRPGFHVNPLGREFTPLQGLYWVVLYLARLNTALLESAIPAVALVVAGLWTLRQPTRWDVLMAALIGVVTIGYGFYWFDGNFAGPRFLFIAVVAFIYFIARLVVNSGREAVESRAAAVRALVVPACLLLALIPSRLTGLQSGVWPRLASMRLAPAAWNPDPAADARHAGLTNALVFVREPLHARMAARLRALGMPPYAAERAAADLDACALIEALDREGQSAGQQALDAVLAQARAAGPARPLPGLIGSSSLALVGGRPSSESCRAEIEGDRPGTETYDRFLGASTIDSSGRLGGEVVYARSLGARDTLLRDGRHASRTWYLYRRDPGQTVGRFERYSPR